MIYEAGIRFKLIKWNEVKWLILKWLEVRNRTSLDDKD